MNTLYNFILGRKKSSTFYVNGDDADEAVSDEVIDENGFVMVKYSGSEDRQQARCTQNEESPIQQQQYKTDTLCQTGDTSSCDKSQSPTPSSSIADIPMQTSALLKTIESCRTFSINHRKYLDLDLLNYNFNTEISVLNDTDVRR